MHGAIRYTSDIKLFYIFPSIARPEKCSMPPPPPKIRAILAQKDPNHFFSKFAQIRWIRFSPLLCIELLASFFFSPLTLDFYSMDHLRSQTDDCAWHLLIYSQIQLFAVVQGIQHLVMLFLLK